MRQHQLFLKRSKCSFGEEYVTHLGHVISIDGVAMDSQKVMAVVDWPVPRIARAVRGFLGLVRYYRKFIRDFGIIAAPLTALLKKDGFIWFAFKKLKTASCQTSAYHSLWNVTLLARDLAQCYTKAWDHWHSLVALLLPVTPPLQLMSVSSLVSYRLCDIGGRTCGVAHSLSKQITTASSFSLTSD
jgi:hypothetical protein